MIEQARSHIPEEHPIRELFRVLTERGMEQVNLRDLETIQYIANLLTEFVPVENMRGIWQAPGQPLHYLPEMLQQTGEPMPAERRREYYRLVGDVALFNLGLFPESLTYGRRTVSLSFYAERGRYFYSAVAGMDASQTTRVFRTLSEHFQECVGGLNWVKRYISDPFYQYTFRQFHVT
jgi:hypothetical protein